MRIRSKNSSKLPGRLLLAMLFCGTVVQAALYDDVQISAHSGDAAGTWDKNRKVLVLLIDGLDPDILELLMNESELPAFAQLRRTGSYRRISMPCPAASRLAWSAFSKGIENCWSHERSTGNTVFWKKLAEQGIESTLLFCPSKLLTEASRSRRIAGTAIQPVTAPDSCYTLVSTDAGWAEKNIQGNIMGLAFGNKSIEFSLSASWPNETGSFRKTVIVMKTMTSKTHDIELNTGGELFYLRTGKWSDWKHIEFDAREQGNRSVLCRFCLLSTSPDLSIYCSPLYPDVCHEGREVSCPAELAAEISGRIGPFAAGRKAPDTAALEDGVLNASIFLQGSERIVAERREVLNYMIDTWQGGLMVCRFSTLVPVQCLSWQSFLKDRLQEQGIASLPGPILRFYKMMDDIVGKATVQLKDERDVALIILSTYGIADFNRKIHMNRVLAELGYLQLKEDRPRGSGGLKDIDWSETRAYARSLYGIRLNLVGRETAGIVRPADGERVLQALQKDLLSYKDPNTLESPFANVRKLSPECGDIFKWAGPELFVGCRSGYRLSDETAEGLIPAQPAEDNDSVWKGSHLVAANAVPGILLGYRARSQLPARVRSVAGYIISQFRQSARSQPDITKNK